MDNILNTEIKIISQIKKNMYAIVLETLCTWWKARAIETAPLIRPAHQIMICQICEVVPKVYKHMKLME